MSAAATDYRTPKALITLAIFVVGVVGVGILIGWLTPPGEWFEQLQKPWWNPPGAVFGPVWTILYVLIGIAGWRIFMDNPRSTAMVLWFVQMALNFLWSPVWFGAEMPWLAFAIIVALWLATIACMFAANRHDKVAPWLFLPYICWVSFATLLCGTIAAMNT